MSIVQKMVVTLLVIGIISGGCLAYIAKWANPLIAANATKETQDAIFFVQKDCKKYERIKTDKIEAYNILNDKNENIGFVVVPSGNGFQGKIKMIIGLKPDMKTIVGMKILEQTETPGLGTKVTEDPFLDQFINLFLEKPISYVKGAAPDKSNCEIQAITGATISSKAVVEIANNGISILKSLDIQEVGNE